MIFVMGMNSESSYQYSTVRTRGLTEISSRDATPEQLSIFFNNSDNEIQRCTSPMPGRACKIQHCKPKDLEKLEKHLTVSQLKFCKSGIKYCIEMYEN